MITTMTPIVVATVVSFLFKETRWLGIISLAVISYVYTIPFLVLGSIAAVGFCYWRFWRR